MGAGASAQFGPALDAAAAKPADGSDLRDFNTAKAEAVQLRRTLAALRYQVNAQGQGASACFEHLHDGMQQWTRYSPEQSCLIATALAGNPDAVIQLPGLPFSVRCGRNATSQGMPVAPDSGLLQVNNNSGACRIVRVALGTAPGGCLCLSGIRPDQVRVLEPAYYGGEAGRDAALSSMADAGTRFYVPLRERNDSKSRLASKLIQNVLIF